jgi:hypothetical protein
MGFETWYQAIPENTELLRRAVEDAQFGEFFTFPSWFASGGAPDPMWPDATEYLGELRALLAAHPGLQLRRLTLDRYHDMVQYLLSPARRRETEERDLGGLAVRGESLLAEHLRGCQGFPIRFVSAARVSEISNWLQQLTEEALRQAYLPKAMEAAAVYKFSEESAELAVILTYVNALIGFYEQAAEHGEAVLVFTD